MGQDRNTEYLWNFFKSIFPSMSKHAKHYHEHGANAISIWFDTEKPVIFRLDKTQQWTIKPYGE